MPAPAAPGEHAAGVELVGDGAEARVAGRADVLQHSGEVLGMPIRVAFDRSAERRSA